MSEKRFKKMDTIIDPFPIWDTLEEKGYNCTDTLDGLVDLLNEQQATITAQKKGLDEYMDNIIALSKENEQLHQKNTKLIAKIDFLERVIDGDV